jgi:hypothetical protein
MLITYRKNRNYYIQLFLREGVRVRVKVKGKVRVRVGVRVSVR